VGRRVCHALTVTERRRQKVGEQMFENINGELIDLSFTEQIAISVLIESRLRQIAERIESGNWDGEIIKMFYDEIEELHTINKKLGY